MNALQLMARSLSVHISQDVPGFGHLAGRNDKMDYFNTGVKNNYIYDHGIRN